MNPLLPFDLFLQTLLSLAPLTPDMLAQYVERPMEKVSLACLVVSESAGTISTGREAYEASERELLIDILKDFITLRTEFRSSNCVASQWATFKTLVNTCCVHSQEAEYVDDLEEDVMDKLRAYWKEKDDGFDPA